MYDLGAVPPWLEVVKLTGEENNPRKEKEEREKKHECRKRYYGRNYGSLDHEIHAKFWETPPCTEPPETRAWPASVPWSIL
jgi:hypothetical protein